MNEQDPWDRIHDADRDIHLPETPQSHEPPKFTKGEIAAYAILGLGVLAGIVILAVQILSAWLDIP